MLKSWNRTVRSRLWLCASGFISPRTRAVPLGSALPSTSTLARVEESEDRPVTLPIRFWMRAANGRMSERSAKSAEPLRTSTLLTRIAGIATGLGFGAAACAACAACGAFAAAATGAVDDELGVRLDDPHRRHPHARQGGLDPVDIDRLPRQEPLVVDAVAGQEILRL